MFTNSLSRATGLVAQNVRSNIQASACITEREAIGLLGKFFNMKYLENIVGQDRSAIQPRKAQCPVSEAGLLAIAAYTSAGLDRMIRETYFTNDGLPGRRNDIKTLESLILETLPKIAPTPVSFAKRNLTLNPMEFKSLYRHGGVVRFERITSVTLQPYQVYRGGNVDLTIKPDFSVIDVTSLSRYSAKHARGEKEALLVPGSVYEVIDIQGRLEDSLLNPSPLFAPKHPEVWSVTLRQTESHETPRFSSVCDNYL